MRDTQHALESSVTEDNPNVLRLLIQSTGTIVVEDRPEDFPFGTFRIALSDDANETRRQGIVSLVEMLREDRLQKQAEYELVGAQLYSVLFEENDLGRKLHETLVKGQQDVHVVLEFDPRKDVDLSAWPWEYLYCPKTAERTDGGYFLGGKERLMFSRRPPGGGKSTLQVNRPPVTVLFVASRPEKYELNYEPVLKELNKLASMEPGETQPRVRVIPLLPDASDSATPGATYENFRNKVREGPHIVHFVGHGQFKGGHGQLLFMNKDGGERWVTDEELVADLTKAGAPENLKLFFIQACESGATDSQSLVDRYQAVSGMAMSLVEKRIPAVVAMQFKVAEHYANLFATRFYRALAEPKPVDVSVQIARLAVLKREMDNHAEEDGGSDGSEVLDNQSYERPAFALPVLYWSGAGSPFPPRDLQPPRSIIPIVPKNCPWPNCQVECEAYEDYCANGHLLKCPNCKAPITKPRIHCSGCPREFPPDGRERVKEGKDEFPRLGAGTAGVSLGAGLPHTGGSADTGGGS
jgi:hypothetical protein